MAVILLIEDDFALAMGTEYALQAEGYEVIHVSNLAEARKAAGLTADGKKEMKDDGKNDRKNDEKNGIASFPDLILLDVMLPDGNGYEFCKELRAVNPQVPIIFLTAVAEEVNIVQGLELGADDYVTKPYRVKELLSRISANLRRAELYKQMEARNQKTILPEYYSFGSHQLDIQEFRLYRQGKLVDITPGEFRLLKELVLNDGIVLTRSRLLEQLYDTGESFVDDNTLSVYIKRLRDTLSEDSDWIETVRGVGYRFRKRENR